MEQQRNGEHRETEEEWRQRRRWGRVLQELYRLADVEKYRGVSSSGTKPWDRTPEQVEAAMARCEAAHVEALRRTTPWLCPPPDPEADPRLARLHELDGDFQARLYNVRAVECGAFTDYWYVPEQRGYGHASRAGGSNKAKEDPTPDEQLEAAKRRVAYYKEQAHYVERLVACNLRKGDRFITLTYADPSMTVERLKDAKDDFKKFLKRLRRYMEGDPKLAKHRDFGYLVGWEVQTARHEKHGQPVVHFHWVGFGLPFIKHAELTRLWGHGHVWINSLEVDEKGQAIRNVAAYIAKYMTKDYGYQEAAAELMGRPRLSRAWTVSRNVRRPKETRRLLSPEQVEALHSGAVRERQYRDRQRRDVVAFRVYHSA